MNSFASLGLIYSVVNLLTRVEAQIVFYQNSSTSLPVSTLVSTSIADFHESSSTGEVRYSSSYSYVQPSIDSFTSSSFLTSFEAPTETSSSYAVSSSLITSDTFSSYSDIFDEETSSLISTSAASSEKASSTLSSTAQPHRTSHSSSSFELPVTAPSSSSLPSSTSLTFTSVNPSQSWTSFNSEKSSALSSTIEFTSSEISGSTSPKSLESLDTTGTITSSYSPSPSSKNSNQTSLLSPLEPLSSSSGDLILSSTIQATTNDQTSKTIPTLVDATSSLPPTLRSSSMAPTSGSDSISHNFTSPPSKTSGNYDVLTSNSIDPSLFTTTSEYSSTQLSSLNQASKSETVNFTASIASTPFGTDSATSLIDPISSVGSTASSFVGISTANFSTQGNSNYVPESTASGSSQYQDWSSSSLPLSQTTWVVINTTNTQGSVTSTTSPAYVSTATKTVDGVITEYVTWCPLTQTKSQAIGVSSSMSSVPQASSFSGSSNSTTLAASNNVPESTASGSSQYQDWSSSSLPLSQTTWVVINTTNTQGSVTSTTSPAYVSTATKTVDGVITEYVTWCPLTQTKSQAIGVSSSMSSVPQASSFSGSSNSTTLVASNNVPESTASGSSQYQDWSSSSLPLSQTTWVVINTTNTQGSVTSTTSPAYVSTATKTVDGVITEYVTWCPLTQTKSQAIGVSSSTISATQTSKPSSILTLGISTLQLSDATFKGTETINTHLMTESTSITEPTYFSGTSDSFYLSTSEVNLASSLSSYPNFSSSEGSTATITNSTVTFGSTSKYPSASVSNPTEASQHVSSSVNSLTDFTSNSTETIAVISNIHKTSSNKDYSLTTTQLKTSGMQTLVLSTVTTTVNGAATEYTTWCPATSIAYTTSISYKTLVLTTEVCSHSECTPTVITSVTATSSTIPLSSTSSSTVLSSTVSEGTKNPAASEVTTNTQVSATSEATSTSTSVTATASESSTTSQVSATSEATSTSTSVTATASESSTTSQVSATSEATSTSTSVTATASESSTTSQVSATSVRATSSESSTTSQVSTASETISTLGTQNFTTTGSLLFPALSTEMINTTVVSRKTLIISTEVCSHSKCVPTVITEVVTSKGTPSNGHSSQTLQTEAVEVTLSSHQTVTMSTEVCSNSICTPTVITSVQMRSTPSPYLTSSTSSSSLASTKKSSLEASSEMSTFSVSTQSLPLAFTSSEKRSTTSASQWSSTVLTNTIMSSSSNVISTNEKPSSTTSPYNFSSGYSLPSSSTPSQYSLSTATTTINGIKTVYTTWCPLAEKSTVAASSQSSRSVDRFVSSSKPSSSLSQTSIQYTLSTATTTISGLKTVYTTWCPLTSKSTLGATTQTSSTAKVRITSASSATSTSISLSTSTESESSSGYLSKGICSGTECTQDVPTESSSPASTLAYSPSVSTSSSSFSTTTASTLTSTHTSVPLLPSSSSISASSPSSTSMLSTSLPSPAFTSSTLPTAIAVSSSTFIASSLPFSSKSSLSLSPVSSSILMSQFSSSSSSSSSSSLASLPSLSISPTVDTVSVLQPTTSIATLTCTDSQCQQEVSTICNGSNCDDVTSTATTPPSTVTDTMTCTGSECQKTTSSSCDGYSCKVSETYKSSATISACSGEGCQASATSELNSQYVTMTSVITPSAITTTSVEVHSTESTISITTVKPVTYTSSDTNGELITITSSSQTVIPSVTTIITRTKVAITSTPKPTTTTYVEQRLSSSGIATSFVAAASSTWITTPIVSTYAGSASKFLCSKFFMIMVMVINFI
ncbi:CLL_collapsed_G0006130.mRNA.1.CDS.1 [Saccharomyces cerevisiae]|uniref:K7_Fig2p n=1 Tax=Saccharomyces cerevisiae (strain Kyokai no. 7 / NBRC 101557) TaxID=721032 RepID=G2WA96_YEASK|nr:K7_Fig2p [Saccharomyces cerevisiae Kyokai no. 7]CAI5230749.1 CLL_HP2_G0005770.mRNA.1.CDS.1 [Saccharomyces cerevisiae]CAI6384285.1 CLL_HP2_G0005770.mRNA.1.CDS.1 [Saccharomyces cerevisiae]CAI6391165.1 CLL_HP1_G0005880.mRNA.1.CDS.1 [Saccharomyces cerevisiae]CAI7172396.1 CLL_collapsed_G0006130.mRNA.1.CDS.1 [Saccharomyces cerevisiae]